MTIRIKICYGGSTQRILHFDESIELPILLRKMIDKLGVTHERDDGDIDLSKLFRLRLHGESELMTCTNAISYGDELVLEKKPSFDYGDSKATVPVEKEHSDNRCGRLKVDDDGNGDCVPPKKNSQDSDLSGTTKNDNDSIKKENTDHSDDSDVISISSDEAEDSSYNEDTGEEEEYDSPSSEDEEKDAKDCGYNEVDNTRSSKRRKRNPKMPPESPLEVIMGQRDIPSAPGKSHDPLENNSSNNSNNDEMEERSLLVDGTGKKKSDQEVKHRIIKLLNTGFHDQSNEHEAKNAMRLAQRLMRKHNLSQALLLKERETKNSQNAEDEEILKGGMVCVKIVNRKTRKPSLFARWFSRLAYPISKNFGVKSYSSNIRGVCCDLVFYGIYSNAQLAGYAFKVATERIAQMMTEYHPKPSWPKISTKSSRLSYAIGIAEGIWEDVEKNLQTEEEQRNRKLERARLAGSRGEAYAESDDEDFGDDNEGVGISIVNEEIGSNNNISRNTLPPNHASSSEANPPHQPRSISGIDIINRVEELEQEEQAALVLVDHNAKIAEEVLKEHDIKFSTTKTRRKPIDFDHRSYEQGIEDSKEIDLNQRAIRDEVKVKVEKS